MGSIKTIMIIDDEQEILTQARQFLKTKHTGIFTAHNSRKALEILQKMNETNLDLLLIDTPLPGTHNKSALYLMKPTQTYSTREQPERFLKKPFTQQQIQQFVQKHLED